MLSNKNLYFLRFDPSKENLQSDHLFEFHAIICNQPSEYILGSELLDASHNSDNTEEGEIGQIQYTEEDVIEEEFVHQTMIQSVELSKETPVVRHSGVWNYFEEQQAEQKVYCLLCRQSNIVHSYSTKSSTSNLRKHLRTTHYIEVENYRPLVKKGKNEERRGYGMSRVWKYFVKFTKNGEIQDRDYVYCNECYKGGVQHRYKQTSSTGTLKAHLRSVHHLNIDAGREYCDNLNESEPVEKIVGAEIGE